LAPTPVRILGVDTALRSSGVGVVDACGNRLSAVHYGTIRNPRERLHSECLHHIYSGISELIEKYAPVAVAVESVFFSRNAQTAMILGEARGAVLAACAAGGLSVYEYAPRRVKQAVVGNGKAQKEQVAKMVAVMLGLPGSPQSDAADALAIAICHIHNASGYAALAPKQI